MIKIRMEIDEEENEQIIGNKSMKITSGYWKISVKLTHLRLE